MTDSPGFDDVVTIDQVIARAEADRPRCLRVGSGRRR